MLASVLVLYMNRAGRRRATRADVEATVSQAIERSAEYFADLWFSRSEAERAVLREVAAGKLHVPEQGAARTLRDYDLLDDEGDFAVPMVGRWIREHRLDKPAGGRSK